MTKDWGWGGSKKVLGNGEAPHCTPRSPRQCVSILLQTIVPNSWLQIAERHYHMALEARNLKKISFGLEVSELPSFSDSKRTPFSPFHDF